MASTSEPELVFSTCAHCQRDIPSSNIDLHFVHCSRNLEKCIKCGEMVPRKLIEEHFNETHTPVPCTLCGASIEREAWTNHKSDSCPQRMVSCKYCELPLPAIDIFEHEDVCGNRTEYCATCQKYVRLCEFEGHQCIIPEPRINPNISSGSSRDRGTGGRAERGPPRRPRNNNGPPHKHIIFTIAITGFAVLIGSVLFLRG
ncbi:hypothetical protein LUZ60_013530 [Juncus effusus]|nr:hypothetical protein LUZ60_013530 [Juncus effusus]